MAGFNGFAPSYGDYIKQYQAGDQSAFSESSSSTLPTQLSEDQWNALPDDQKWSSLVGLGSGHSASAQISIDQNDPRYKDLAPLFTKDGQTDNNPSLTFTYAPNYDPAKDPGHFLDPNLVHSANGVYGFSSANESPDYKNARAKANGFSLMPFILPLAFVGAGLAAGAAGGAAAGAEAGAAGADAAGTDAAITGAEAGTASEGASLYGGSQAAADAANASLVGDLGGSAGVPVSEGATPILGDSSNFAPVSEGSTPIPGSVPSTGNGLIDGARGAWDSASAWYKGLSPASRFLLGQAVSQGSGAIMRGIAARNAAAQQRAIIDQHRSDVVRRGQVPVFSSGAFKPKPPAGG